MLPQFFLIFILLKMGYAQLDGEFWWLKDEFTKYVGTKAPVPTFENSNEIETAESAKNIFKDDNFLEDISTTVSNTNTINRKEEKISKEQNRHNILWPGNFNISNKRQNLAVHQRDKFHFNFPEDNVFKKKKTTTESLPVRATASDHVNISENNTVFHNDKMSFPSDHDGSYSENICTYVIKSDCHRQKGEINIDVIDEKQYGTNENLICCILPSKQKHKNDPSTISASKNKKHRSTRSKKNHAQRHILLRHNYQQHNRKTTPTLQYDDDDDVENDDYDPYANIKIHEDSQSHEDSKEKDKYNHNDYQENYAVEIPMPGLTGLYSDPKDDMPLSYDDEDNTDFGYSTINPRLSSNKKKKSKQRRKPSKVKPGPASEEAYNEDNQFISYQSDPNFNALQDFKLPNLTRKKVLKVPRSTTTESFYNINSIDREETTYETIPGQFDRNSEIRQVFNECGATAKPLITTEKQIGYTTKGSHPWLALLVPTHKQNKLLCYASLIHPRAAISAGDCVHSKPPGEVTLIAGIWSLVERPRSGKRPVIPLLHPNYKSGFMDNNLAMLHWKKPLQLGMNVQPICLGQPSPELECVFVGWGGFDQAIRTKSRWQRATIQNCQVHTSLIGIDIPKDAFCASVESRSTVTGIGGSLICITGNHLSAVGVAVSRDSTLILLPTYEWITSPSIESFIGVTEE